MRTSPGREALSRPCLAIDDCHRAPGSVSSLVMWFDSPFYGVILHDKFRYFLSWFLIDCEVQVDESYVPALQDEAMEVEHLLAEPRNNLASLDGIFHFNE
ncbi:hypothetical protein VNO80_13170 [Phaseolus coccineus]|uniref:Uncharacterized protein n=1 Tax=Phaseolus coccineus TaxID=3886 RepID=A0AAN9N5T3_PHACN